MSSKIIAPPPGPEFFGASHSAEFDDKPYAAMFPNNPYGPSQQTTSNSPSSTMGYQNSSNFDRSYNTNVRMSKAPPGYFEQLAGLGLGIGNLFAETLLSHPCVVLRRQCQVNNRALKYHLTPFTLLPSLYKLPNVSHNGIICFWKGVPSTVILRCMCYGFDSILGDFFGLPKEATRYSSYSKIASHLLLKSLTYAITTPFLISNVSETVQSDVIIDRPGLFDCIKEGFLRVSSDVVGSRDTRRIPIWYLIGPSVAHRLSHYVLSSLARYKIHGIVKRQIMDKPSRERTLFDDFFPDLFASFASFLMADAILYPIETVMHRLYLQGLRVIVDNLDSNQATVIPVATRYDGFLDCVRCIFRDEGWSGFYKGFGALLLQYALHMAVLRALRLLFERLEEAGRNRARHSPNVSASQQASFQNTQVTSFHHQGTPADGYHKGAPAGPFFDANVVQHAMMRCVV